MERDPRHRDRVEALDASSADGAPSSPRRRWPWVVGFVVVIAVVAGFPLLASLGDINRVEVDQDDARRRLAATPPDVAPTEVLVTPSPESSGWPTPTSTPSPSGGSTPAEGRGGSPGAAPPGDRTTSSPPVGPADHRYRSFLVIGSDGRGGLSGSRADVLIVGLVPRDGSAPVMFSLPRDLWLDDPCHGGARRINASFNGCPGRANGFELTSIVVEDFTGIEVDHVAAIDFEGFKQVINAVGGVEICVDNPVRDGGFSLPAGCTMADGEQALGWVRSRKTQELVDGEWRTMPGVNDLTRNRRQQQVMLQLLGRVGSFGTVSNLYSFAEGVSDSVTIGSGLSLFDGARLAWSMRGRTGDIQRFSIPVTGTTTSAGAQVLVPTEPFAETFEDEVGVDLRAAN